MAEGNYDHPSYVTRQILEVVSSAGAANISGYKGFISDLRLRKVAAVVRVAGTSSGTGNSANLIYVGTSYTGYGTLGGTNTLTTNTTTNTLCTFALGSSAAGAYSTSTDVNARLIAGGYLAIKNGTDATGTASLTLEINLDPGASWTGPPGA